MNITPSIDLQAKSVRFESGDQAYQRLLSGPPETRSIRSGLVILSPGKSIGLHSTKTNEEVIVPLSGQGELRIANQSPIDLVPNLIAYVPPQTEHDVINLGEGDLKYIFIVAAAT